MFTAEQLALNPEEFELIFLGNIQEENEYYNIAHNYIRNISLGINSHRKEIDSSMNMIEPHQHFVLLSQF